jgi:hypothetical protein
MGTRTSERVGGIMNVVTLGTGLKYAIFSLLLV